MYQDGTLIKEFGERKQEEIVISFKFRDKFIIKPRKKVIKIEFINARGQKVDLYPKPVLQRKSYDLINYYHTLNPETCNLQHFGLVQNECIRRNLIKGEVQSLNDFNTDFENIGA